MEDPQHSRSHGSGRPYPSLPPNPRPRCERNPLFSARAHALRHEHRLGLGLRIRTSKPMGTTSLFTLDGLGLDAFGRLSDFRSLTCPRRKPSASMYSLAAPKACVALSTPTSARSRDGRMRRSCVHSMPRQVHPCRTTPNGFGNFSAAG